MTDEQLGEYIPHYGDRLALRNFLTRKCDKRQNERRHSLFERLRGKLKRHASPDKECVETRSNSPQHVNAVKKCKTIGIGLMQFDDKKQIYTQIRTKLGGGTRNTSMSKLSTKSDILSEAKRLFFPDGYSVKFGPEVNYEFDVMDYQYVSLESDVNIQSISEITKLSNLRFYLAMKKVQDVNHAVPVNQQKYDNVRPSTSTSRASGAHDNSSGDPTSTMGFSEDNPDDDVYLPNILPLPENLLSGAAAAATESQQSNIDVIDSLINELADEQSSVNHHVIRLHRGHVFKELKSQFRQKRFNFEKDVFTLQMVLPNGDTEVAEDNGGVVRDALVEFWDSFYEECTFGRVCKVPFIRHDYDDAEWKSVASVLFFGWKQQKYFPIHLSKAFMSCCIFGMDLFSEKKSHLISEFLSFLPFSESNTIDRAMKGDYEADELVDILSSHECRVVPNQGNLEQLVAEIAHKELIQQPMYIKNCWFDQLATLGFELGDTSLDTPYQSLTATPRKVLKVLAWPENMSTPETETASYLTKFVKELEPDSLPRFLRFCTGTNLLLTDGAGNHKPIFVRFNCLSGLARRPVAHTYVDVFLNCLNSTTATLTSERSSVQSSEVKSGLWILFRVTSTHLLYDSHLSS